MYNSLIERSQIVYFRELSPMCSARKRSFYEVDSSDDDFDYSLQKRLKMDCIKTERSNSKRQGKNSRRTHKNSSRSNFVKSEKSTSSSVTHSIEALGRLTTVDSINDDTFVTDNISTDSSHIIAEILDDDRGDVVCAPQPLTITPPGAPTSPIQKPIEVPSPKKQLTLLDFFKVERNGVVVTKETLITNNTRNKNFKMYQSESSQMVFKKPSEPKINSSFCNKTNRDCPFYKKIPGTYHNIRFSLLIHMRYAIHRHCCYCGCISVWEYCGLQCILLITFPF